MRMRLLLVAALAATGLSLATPVVVEAQATDNVLRVARGATSRDISVFINRAIVLESAQRFAEVSVANPGIADVAALSD
jgi:pilus assembly protein CpaC